MTVTPQPPEVDRPRRSSSLLTGASLAAAGITATVAVGLPTLCPFRICTGQACPGCGLSRSLLSLAKGDFALSWKYHPLLIPVLVQVLVVGSMRHFARQDQRRGDQGQYRGLRTAWLNKLLVANLVIFLVVWLARWKLGLLGFVVT